MNNNSNGNNNNDDNIFVNLPIILLKKITNYLNDDIDKIIFTLVCKRWYSSIDDILSYFTIEGNVLFSYNKDHLLNFMKSYRNILQRSLYVKDSITFSINNKEENTYDATLPSDYDYSVFDNDIDLSQVLIPSHVNKLVLGKTNQPLEEQSVLFEKHPNIRTLKLTDYRYQLKSNSIPQQITELCYSVNTDSNEETKEIQIDALHNRLEVLRLEDEAESESHYILNGKFPSSIRKIDLYSVILTMDSIPTEKLEKIHLPRINGSIIKNLYSFQFAKSLRVICCQPSWIAKLRGFLPPSLEKIDFYYEDPYDYQLTANDIPPTVKTLDYSTSGFILPPGCIPTTVKSLTLSSCNIQLENSENGIRFFNENHCFDKLVVKLSDPVRACQLPKAKSLTLYFSNIPELEKNSLTPELGIEHLDIVYSKDIGNGNRLIPNTVKSLTLLNRYSSSDVPFKMLEGDIPDSVETLCFSSSFCDKILDMVFPKSIKHLKINFSSMAMMTEVMIAQLKELLPSLETVTLNGRRVVTIYRKLDSDHFIKYEKHRKTICSGIIHSSNLFK